MGKLKFSKGIKSPKIKKTISFKVGNTTVRCGKKGVSTSTKICKGARYTTYAPYPSTNTKLKQKNNNKFKSEKYKELKKKATAKKYTRPEAIKLMDIIIQSGLSEEEKKRLFSLIKIK